MIDCPVCKERTFNPHPRRRTCSSCGSVVPAFGQAIIWGRFPVPEGHTFVRLKDGKLLTKTDGSPFFVPYGYKVARRIDGSVFEKSDATPWLVPNDYSQDEQGNFRSATRVRIEDGHVKVEHDYLLEPGATTLRGQYPKLAPDDQCAYPERLDCNHGSGYDRCEFMHFAGAREGFVFGGPIGDWRCAHAEKLNAETSVRGRKTGVDERDA